MTKSFDKSRCKEISESKYGIKKCDWNITITNECINIYQLVFLALFEDTFMTEGQGHSWPGRRRSLKTLLGPELYFELQLWLHQLQTLHSLMLHKMLWTPTWRLRKSNQKSLSNWFPPNRKGYWPDLWNFYWLAETKKNDIVQSPVEFHFVSLSSVSLQCWDWILWDRTLVY